MNFHIYTTIIGFLHRVLNIQDPMMNFHIYTNIIEFLRRVLNIQDPMMNFYIYTTIIEFLRRVLNIHGGVTEGLWSCYGVIMESASFIIISIVNAIQMVTIDIMYQVL